MKKAVLILIIMLCLYTDLCAFGDVYVARLSLPTLGANVATTTDYCSSQSWNTLTPFRLDFDHTSDTKNACLASGTETGSCQMNF